MKSIKLSMMVLMMCVLAMAGCNANKQESQQAQEKSTPTKSEPKKEVAEGAKTVTEEKKSNSENTFVTMKTSKGDLVIELFDKEAPITVENFISYVNDGFYDGLIFHRVIPGFMIQGGGFTPDMNQKRPNPPIKNEASNGLKNDRGTLAMARTMVPDSATCQFFINVNDNSNLNYTGPANPGYAVFGKVVEGMDVADAIVSVPTGNKGPHQNVPNEPIAIESARITQNP